MTGTVPAWTASPTSTSRNQLTGEIPGLAWGCNELNGEIPGELGSLTNLTILELGDNELTGPIPTELGSIANLQVLALGGNQLTGTVPARPGWQTVASELGNLQELYLWGNELNGEIPGELGSLTNLTILELGDNELTGIPAWRPHQPPRTVLGGPNGEIGGTGHLTNLQVLAFGGNQLTGKIPAWLGSLTSLQSGATNRPFLRNQLDNWGNTGPIG